MEQIQNQNKDLLDAFKFWRVVAIFMLAVSLVTTIGNGITISKMRLAATETEMQYKAKLESAEHIRDLAVEQLGGMAREVDALKDELAEIQRNQIETQSDEIPAGGQLVSLGEFTLTAYCPCEKCCGKWANGITASGLTAEPGMIAVDPQIIPLGACVVIDGEEYLAADTGGAIKGNRIDIYMSSHNSALEYGVQTAEVWLAEP